ncbi:MAG: prephenate dehydrogenase [Chloroflexi bacterium]|nr:prephenate dehydrogenase [Chloroflexota bacterium]
MMQEALRHCHVGIIGLGLMGGSLAMALREAQACAAISGYDVDQNTLDQALRRGIIDRPIDLGGDHVDVLILAAPVNAILDWLIKIPAVFSGDFHVIDLGSTKGAITAVMQSLPDRISPLGGHPMCGKETSGLGVATPDLYRKCLFVLTPLDRTHATTLAVAQQLIDVISARAFILDPDRHDQLAAAISHVPYLTSIALGEAALQAHDEAAWEMAASGFRDSTRLAASDVTMMLDIILSNREGVLTGLSRLRTALDMLADLIEQDDRAALQSVMDAARSRRTTLFT